VAVIDELGYIRIVDRMKDLVKSDGEWISSLKLEEQLLDHPAVVEAAVVAVPDAKTGERPLACVVLRAEDGASVTGEQLREFLSSRVAASWVPDTIEPVAALPKTSIGKIDKKTLRARYSGGTA
jgi:fatty-acyl-CoA synthase